MAQVDILCLAHKGEGPVRPGAVGWKLKPRLGQLIFNARHISTHDDHPLVCLGMLNRRFSGCLWILQLFSIGVLLDACACFSCNWTINAKYLLLNS
jgi:hypothetical protein